MKTLRYIKFIEIIKKVNLIITIILVLYLPLRFILDDFARWPQAYMQTNISTDIQKQILQGFEELKNFPLKTSVDKIVIQPKHLDPMTIRIYCTVPTNESDFFQHAEDGYCITADQITGEVVIWFTRHVLPDMSDGRGMLTWIESGEKLPRTYTTPPQIPKIIGILIVINFPLRMFLNIMKKVLTNNAKKKLL